MAIDNIPNLAWLKTAPPLQKRRAAAEAKCYSDRLESAAHMRRVAKRRTAAHDCNAAPTTQAGEEAREVKYTQAVATAADS